MSDNFIVPPVPVDNFEIQRQDSNLYEVNGSIYISTVGHLLRGKSFHRGRVIPYIMDKKISVDINDLTDWKIAEGMIQ